MAEEMIVKNNNNPSTPVRVTTSAAASDEMKEPAAITSTSSSSTINNIGPSTPGRMVAGLSKRIRSFHHSTSRNEDSRDDDINNSNSMQLSACKERIIIQSSTMKSVLSATLSFRLLFLV